MIKIKNLISKKNITCNKLLNNFKFYSFSTQGDKTKTPTGFTSKGLSKKGTEDERRIGQNEKFRMKFTNKEEKEIRSKILKQEITSNPEFFNAFPHLKEKIKSEDIDNPAEEVSDFVKRNYYLNEEQGMPDEVEKRGNYFESMLNGRYKGYDTALKTKDEKEYEMKKTFLDGYEDPKGPIKFMPREEKEKIHMEIDKRMKELEDTGLSREEILYNKPEGFPLKSDKFFQFIKNNKLAREMLIKPSEAFNADLVIERALKQDIGPDASIALKRKNFKLEEDLHQAYPVQKYSDLYDPKKPDLMLQKDDFNYKENYLNKLKLHLNSERTRPISFVNPPLTKGQLRKKFMIHTIKSKDIHWKNLPLLVRFVNEGGKLMNRYQTRLPARIHRKLSRTIKHVRNMGLLPFVDFIKPYHKLPFTSLYNEFAQETSKVVDIKSGMIKVIHQPSDKDKFNYSSYDSAASADKARIS